MREETDYLEAFEEFKEDKYVFFEPWERSIDHLRLNITGKEDTPYENGQFLFEIKLPENYPFQPPFVYSHTHIWHLHISSEIPPGKLNVKLGGLINPDLVGKIEEYSGRTGWMPSNTLSDVITAIKDIIHLNTSSKYFIIDDPVNKEAYFQYVNNMKQFERIAKKWTIKYATETEIKE